MREISIFPNSAAEKEKAERYFIASVTVKKPLRATFSELIVGENEEYARNFLAKRHNLTEKEKNMIQLEEITSEVFSKKMKQIYAIRKNLK